MYTEEIVSTVCCIEEGFEISNPSTVCIRMWLGVYSGRAI